MTLRGKPWVQQLGSLKMKNAEQVTFGGSALDRAGEVRSNPNVIQSMKQASNSTAVVFWRGKPLIYKTRPAGLMRLGLDHPILEGAADHLILLGREDGVAVFAHDLSAWEPDGLDADALGGFLDPSEQQHPSLSENQVFAELRRVMTWLNPRDAELAASGRAIFSWHESHGFCAKCGVQSVVSNAGWQRDCPACHAHHFPRTDPVVIMLITNGDNVLMGRSPGWPEGMYSLLAGFVEPGETLEAAVRREVFEESGVRVGDVSYLSSQPWPFPASLMFGCAGVALSDEINIDPVEIEDAMWVSRDEMMRIFAGQHPKILPARKGAIAHFLLENWLADSMD